LAVLSNTTTYQPIQDHFYTCWQSKNVSISNIFLTYIPDNAMCSIEAKSKQVKKSYICTVLYAERELKDWQWS